MRHPDHAHPATLARRAEAEALRRVAWQSCAADSPSPTISEARHIEAGTCSPCPHAAACHPHPPHPRSMGRRLVRSSLLIVHHSK